MRILELFAGIGGVAAAAKAIGPPVECVEAFDIDTAAATAYRANFSTPYHTAELSTIPRYVLARSEADVWWMSPPCLPHSVRGRRLDLEDPRSAAFGHLVAEAVALRPRAVVVENVPGFLESQANQQLEGSLSAAGYATHRLRVCPTQFGWPNRRDRVYVVATREDASAGPYAVDWDVPRASLSDSVNCGLRRTDAEWLWLDPAVAQRFEPGLDRVDAADPAARTACFGASYGKSILQAGSYLITPEGLRRFSPREVEIVLGFPDSFVLPEGPPRTAWRLLGNSLSIPVVRELLRSLTDYLRATPIGSSASATSRPVT